MGISNVLSLLCGVALFLYGMSVMGDGLKRVAGNKLEVILWRLSSTPLKGVLLGLGVTAAIQSSSATTIMVIGFVNSGMMKGVQSIPIILGANVGTSVTGWLLCLSLLGEGGGWVSLFSTATITAAVAIAGTILRMVSKSSVKKHVGDILLGFAVLMFGMSVMSDAVLPLKESARFRELLLLFDNPLLGILVGAAFTAVLQSASAAVGILQALSMTGAITAEAAIPIIMGIAIGASVPVLLGAIGAGPTGRRTALVYLFINVLGTLICLIPYFIATALLPEHIRHGAVGPVELAAINSGFRILSTVALLPFINGLRRLAHRLVKDRPEDLAQQAMIDRLEERFVVHPSLAIEQSKIVLAKMADTAQENLVRALKLLNRWSDGEFEAVERLEQQVDTYEDKLGTYLVQVNRQELNPEQNKEISKFLHCISDIERISDHAMNVGEVAREIAEKKVTFSVEAKRELNALIAAVEEIVGLAMGAFEAENVKEAYRVEPLEEMIDMLCDELKLHHVNRVQAGECTLDQGFVFNDLITDLERVADHCSNIAVAMIELEAGAFDIHEYLNSLQDAHSDSFKRYFDAYKHKYDLAREDFSTGIYDLSKAESSGKSAASAAAPASVSSAREP